MYKTGCKSKWHWECFSNTFLSGILQGSILGSILSKIFTNDLFFSKNVELPKFADGNSIYTARNSTEELIKVLEKEIKSATGWSKMNDVIVNPDKWLWAVIKKKTNIS